MVSPVPAAGMFPDTPDMRWPRLRQYCSAIFTATSTDIDPESQKNTVSNPDGVMVSRDVLAAAEAIENEGKAADPLGPKPSVAETPTIRQH
jgi:hypothetical protein